MPILALFGLGTPELIAIVVVVLILFGAKKIPQFARGLGQGIREFKDAANTVTREVENEGRDIKNVVQNDPQRPQS